MGWRARRSLAGLLLLVMRKPAASLVPIHPLLAGHFTTHAFDPERPVELADRMAILEAARWAPSWGNREPWRFVICDRFERPEAWREIFGTLAARERPWVYNVALLIAVVAELEAITAEMRARALFDTGAAALQLTLEATARGLATHTTSGFDHARLRAVLGIPEHAICVALLCVGQPADAGTLGRDVYRREIASRTRSAPSSRCFDAHWGRPLAAPSNSSVVASPSDSMTARRNEPAES